MWALIGVAASLYIAVIAYAVWKNKHSKGKQEIVDELLSRLSEIDMNTIHYQESYVSAFSSGNFNLAEYYMAKCHELENEKIVIIQKIMDL